LHEPHDFREVLEIRVKIRRLLLAALAAAVLAVPVCSLHAQVTATAAPDDNTTPPYSYRWDVFAGAQYTHFNPSPGDQIHAINTTGWTAGATAWLKPAIGLEALTRNTYGTIIPPVNGDGITSYPTSQHLFLFGPTVRMIRRQRFDAGMHLDIGAAYGIFDDFHSNPNHIMPINLDIYNDKLAFAVSVGGFTDYNIRPHWAVRLVTDWQPTHYGYSRQDEFAGSLGIVYKWGHIHTR
jgi:hypothetical protein